MASQIKTKSNILTSLQLTLLSLLRIAIGWHFLYEGIVKLTTPNWSSAAFLSESKWIFSGLFNWITANPSILKMVDFLNIWGLILIGLGLFLGVFTRVAIIAGISLLTLYYIAIPPFIGLHYGMPTEGSYLVVDKTLIELFTLIVLAFFRTGTFLGLDRILYQFTKLKKKPITSSDKKQTEDESDKAIAATEAVINRREILKSLATIPLFGAFTWAVLKKRGWESYEEKHLLAAKENPTDVVTSATIKTFQFSSLKDLKGQIPHSKIGDLEVSRLIMGGNLIGGWAHSRDLIYVSKLVKAYHHDQKVFDTFKIAEKCGINTILTNPQLSRVINEYWRKEKGKIQFISDCGYKDDVITGIKLSIDGGAHACYVQGEIADRYVISGRMELLSKALEYIRENKMQAGIGAHKIETIKACVEYGLKPDFWVKTLHHTNYWSAQPEQQHDNIWCCKPEETIDFMATLEQPWIAFKILAAGAIHPTEGFPFAFNNGADFICVGMYDFQIVEDVNLALEVLNGNLERKRPWRA